MLPERDVVVGPVIGADTRGLGVPLNATNKHPGFTSRLSCVTKSMLVSGNFPDRPNARATPAIVHKGCALMQPSAQVPMRPHRGR